MKPITITPSIQEHLFAEYIRILGKGKHGSRNLTYSEAKKAMQLLLEGNIEKEQLGAFFLLLRYQGETADELAGFASVARHYINAPNLSVDIDWPSYAGKKRHYPWYLLAAKLLVEQGIKIVLHGAGQHTAGRYYTEQFLQALSIPLCDSWQTVENALAKQHIAFIPLNTIAPKLQQFINLRPLLGVRSPIHSVVRLLNPFNARCSLQSIFHPEYQALHQQANYILGYNSIVIRGEGGENEVRPDSMCTLLGTTTTDSWQETWAATTQQRLSAPDHFDPDYFITVCNKQQTDDYADATIPVTIAVALRGLGIPKLKALREGEKIWKNHLLNKKK